MCAERELYGVDMSLCRNGYTVFIQILQRPLAGRFPVQSHIHHSTTICPGNSDPFYIVSYCIKLVTTYWTRSTTTTKTLIFAFFVERDTFVNDTFLFVYLT